ncbi:MAG: CDP-2,3-bis-(O-geranylgeranyl)-sn-glycerol synthase, partial [Thermoprotei archaeon]
PGDPAPILDQLLFIVVALLLASLYEPLPTYVFVTALLLTLIAHFLSNVIAYALKLKSKPW